jgi:hypothetical protein
MRQSRGEGRYDEEGDEEDEQEDYERTRRPDSRIDGGGGGGLRPGEGSGDESAYTEEEGDSYSQSDRTLSQVTHLTVRSPSSCPTSCTVTARVEISRCDALSNREERNPGASSLFESPTCELPQTPHVLTTPPFCLQSEAGSSFVSDAGGGLTGRGEDEEPFSARMDAVAEEEGGAVGVESPTPTPAPGPSQQPKPPPRVFCG